jgi:hypothetical protein
VAEFDSVIPAGGSGTLTAKVKTKATQNGRLSKSVSVQTDAPGAEHLRLMLSFKVFTPIVASPRFRIYLTTTEGETASERLLLHRTDGEALELTPISNSVRSAVEVRVQPVKKAEEIKPRMKAEAGDVWLEVELKKSDQAFTHNGKVVVATNHPDAPRIEIPMVIRVRPLIDVRPAVASLWASGSSGMGRSTMVRLTHGGAGVFRVTGVEVSHPELFTASVLSNERQRSHNLRVSLADEVTAESLDEKIKGTVRLRCADTSKTIVEIPVELSPGGREPMSQLHIRQPQGKTTAQGSTGS